MQEVHNIGPIPRGRWVIGPAFTHPLAGPVCMRLTPEVGTETFGRDGFLMHGDLPGGKREASEGCVVMPRTVREQVAASEDRALVVV